MSNIVSLEINSKKLEVEKPFYTSIKDASDLNRGCKQISSRNTVGQSVVDLTNYLPSKDEYPDVLVHFQAEAIKNQDNDWSDTRVWSNCANVRTVARVVGTSTSDARNDFWLPIDSTRKMTHEVYRSNSLSNIWILGWMPIKLEKLKPI